jgi:hypothetical protein
LSIISVPERTVRVITQRQAYIGRDGDAEALTAKERLPAGWAALAILGLSAAAWALIIAALWLH